MNYKYILLIILVIIAILVLFYLFKNPPVSSAHNFTYSEFDVEMKRHWY